MRNKFTMATLSCQMGKGFFGGMKGEKSTKYLNNRFLLLPYNKVTG